MRIEAYRLISEAGTTQYATGPSGSFLLKIMRKNVIEGLQSHLRFMAIRETSQGVEIDLQVTANSDITATSGYDEWSKRIKFKTKHPAEKGKANKDVLRFFNQLFKKPVVLKSGDKSKKKTVLILGATKKDLPERFDFE